MFSILNYQNCYSIYKSNNSLVFRGQEVSTKKPVILKLLNQDFPSPEELTKYKQEYQILCNFNSDKIIKAYNIKIYNNSLMLVLEDFGGESLNKSFLNKKFEIYEKLEIAIKIIDALAFVHKNNIIHKDINPSNIIYNKQTRQVKIIDFGISTNLNKEKLIKNYHFIEGTLPYISPEQTGRINRYLDYRSDFYSLGATFYEILTEEVPFNSDLPEDLIYCHIAKLPKPPNEINSKIPQAISDLIMKLMAKDPNNRYQSSSGIKTDLKKCLNLFKDQGNIFQFKLGCQDFSGKFQIKEKLYGREHEIKKLLKSFELVCQGSKKLTLISGSSGIGKSALVNVLHEPILKQKGYFISGKFDQYQQNVPYNAIIQAVNQLIKYLLSKNQNNLNLWQKKIIQNLDNNGQALVDIIPKVKLLLNEHLPPIPKLPPSETENRFNLVFKNFINVFARAEHPLTIFIDDLQWADSASLKLIKFLITASDINYLFVIGTYRDNEITANNILYSIPNKIDNTNISIDRIFLKPLNYNNVYALISDNFNSDKEEIKSVCELLLSKTNGDPFFIIEFLHSLYRQNLVSFDYNSQTWKWKIYKIKSENITSNVIELLIDKIKLLNIESQKILTIAACIGNVFELNTLADIAQKSLKETAVLLKYSVAKGLIFPLNNTYKSIELDIKLNQGKTIKIKYKFIHDRIQQAAYSLISSQEKAILHLNIGRLLLKNTSQFKLKNQIFDIVNQLNLGKELTVNQREKDKLAKLNLIASKKAKQSAAYELAFNYIEIAIELVENNKWKHQYNLSLDLHTEATEIAFLNSKFELMDRFANEIFIHAKELLEKIIAYKIQISAYIVQNKHLEALEIGLLVLRKLGIYLPKYPSQLRLIYEFFVINQYMSTKKIDYFINLPEMTDPHKLAIINILHAIIVPVYSTSPKLFALINLYCLKLIIKYGNTPLAFTIYSGFGIFLIALDRDINRAYNLGLLTLNLFEKFNASEYECETLQVVYIHLIHWKIHIKDYLDKFESCYKNGLKYGNLEFAFYSKLFFFSYSFLIGKNLLNLEKKLNNYFSITIQLKQKVFSYNILLLIKVVTILNNKNLLNIELHFKEIYQNNDDIKINFKENKYFSFIFHFYKFTVYYLFEDYLRAFENNCIAEKNLEAAISSAFYSTFYFYNSLILIKIYESKKQKSLFNKITKNQKKMYKWARHAPMNYQHKYDLVAAELNRIKGNKEIAANLYQAAIAGAKKHEYLNEEALAWEVAAKFYCNWNKLEIAQLYMREAHYKYKLWGAYAKVKHLEERYSELLPEDKIRKSDPNDVTTISSTISSKIKLDTLDLATILETDRALSKENNLEKLLATIVSFATQNVGAQTGLKSQKSKVKGQNLSQKC